MAVALKYLSHNISLIFKGKRDTKCNATHELIPNELQSTVCVKT